MPVLLLLVAIGLGSCKKNREVKAVITVMHDTVDIVGLDTLGQPMFDTIISEVTGASVRMWSDQIGSNIDTTIETNTSGQAEFEFEHVAILRLNVRMDISNHLNQRPQPRRSVLPMAENSIDNCAFLNVHWIDTDFITVCGDFSNPFRGVVEGVSLRHEWGFE